MLKTQEMGRQVLTSHGKQDVQRRVELSGKASPKRRGWRAAPQRHSPEPFPGPPRAGPCTRRRAWHAHVCTIPSTVPHQNTGLKTVPSPWPSKPCLHPTLPPRFPVIEINLLLSRGFLKGRHMSPGRTWFIPWDNPVWRHLLASATTSPAA